MAAPRSGFFETVSRSPERAWPDGVQHHGARVVVLLTLAVVTASFFPVAVVPDFPSVEAGLVVDRDLIAEIGFGVPKPEAELLREREQAAAAVVTIFTYDSAAADTMRARTERLFDALEAAVAAEVPAAEIDRRLRATLSA
ncbi:MAG: hypothetical protein L0271_23845, partial [Gemmatimonadetes bacterium]|nr:hypothetical protein [Gemmatimonadota bacterium]